MSTLFLTPVVYRLVAGFSKPRNAEAERLDRELAEASVTPAPRRGPVRVPEKADELPIAAE
jgi:HAE1 family hydrophobic/amphiphilic exporter-1